MAVALVRGETTVDGANQAIRDVAAAVGLDAEPKAGQMSSWEYQKFLEHDPPEVARRLRAAGPS